jgi:hypothetical protein
MAAMVLVLAGILTFVTRGIEKSHKAATSPAFAPAPAAVPQPGSDG